MLADWPPNPCPPAWMISARSVAGMAPKSWLPVPTSCSTSGWTARVGDGGPVGQGAGR